MEEELRRDLERRLVPHFTIEHPSVIDIVPLTRDLAFRRTHVDPPDCFEVKTYVPNYEWGRELHVTGRSKGLYVYHLPELEFLLTIDDPVQIIEIGTGFSELVAFIADRFFENRQRGGDHPPPIVIDPFPYQHFLDALEKLAELYPNMKIETEGTRYRTGDERRYTPISEIIPRVRTIVDPTRVRVISQMFRYAVETGVQRQGDIVLDMFSFVAYEGPSGEVSKLCKPDGKLFQVNHTQINHNRDLGKYHYPADPGYVAQQKKSGDAGI